MIKYEQLQQHMKQVKKIITLKLADPIQALRLNFNCIFLSHTNDVIIL